MNRQRTDCTRGGHRHHGRALHRALSLVWAFTAVAMPRAGADTFVGGDITTNSTWDLVGSPYRVTSTVTIRDSARLTIEAGVTVRFASGTALHVAHPSNDGSSIFRGSLVVNGSSGSPVVLTPESGLPGGWQGVIFGPRSDDSVSSTLSYLTVEKAGQINLLGYAANVTLYYTGAGGALSFSNVKANNGAGTGWYAINSVLPLGGGCEASQNSAQGIYASSSTVNATGVTIASNGGVGVQMSGSGGTLSGCTISGNASYGAYLVSSSPTIENGAISGNGSYAVGYALASCSPVISGNTLLGNSSPGILVTGGFLPGNHRFYAQTGERFYTVTTSGLDIQGSRTLTVDGGVTVRFASGTWLHVAHPSDDSSSASRGSLVVNGNSGSPVTFTSQSGAAGGWDGVIFGPRSDDSVSSTLSYLTVEKAGQLNTLGYTANITLNGTGAGGALSFSNVKANEGSGKGWQATGSTLPLGSGCEANWNGAEGIYATGSSLALNGAHVWQNAGRGIELAACSGSITGCDISANGGYGVHYGIADSTVAIDGNTFAANADPGILVTGGSLIADHRFYAQTGENTFTVTGADVDIQGLRTLTVDAGVTVRFASNLGLNVAHPNGVLAAHRGSLVVNGSSGSPVTFTSQSGAPGGWEGVTFGPQSDDLVSSTLSYLTVEKAGQINLLGYAANVTLYYTGAGGALSFSNVKANNGAGTGWYAINSVLPLGGGCEASQNSAQGIYASSSTVNATGVTIASNGGVGVQMSGSGGTLSGCTISGNASYGAYLVSSSPTIENGAISGNGSYAVGYALASCSPVISGNTLLGNSSPGILVTGGFLPGNHRFYAQTGERFYTVTTSGLDIQGSRTLTVDGGVTVRFASGTWLHVAHPSDDSSSASRGSLVVNGNSGSPVTFTSQSGAAGGWDGVIFGPRSDDSVSSTLSYLTVEKAGQPNTLGYTANITLNGTGAGGALSFGNVKANEGSGKGWQATGSTLPLGSGCEANWNGAEGIYATGSSLALNGAHVWQNAGRGIELAACSGSITGCDISANGGYGMHYGIADSTVAIDGNTFAANADPGILVTGGSLIADHRFYAQTGENTFTVTGADVDIQGLRTLTVDAGVTVRFASNLGLNVAHPNGVLAAHRGSLVVNGSSGSPVTFTSQSGAPGGWEGVTFGPQSDDLVSSTLSYLTVEKAGQINLLGYAANVTLYYTGAGGALSFSNVKANNGAGTGWYAINSVLPLGGGCEASQNSAQGIYASSSTVNATGVTIASNGGVGVQMSGSGGTLSGCTISGNASYGAYLVSSSPTIENGAISGNGSYAVGYALASCSPVISGNTLLGNSSPGILVTGGFLPGNHRFYAQTGERFYTVTTSGLDIQSSRTLTVDGGVTVRFASGTWLHVAHPSDDSSSASRGSLVVNGNSGSPVTFTSQSGAAGGWDGVIFGPRSDDSVSSTLSYLTVEKAGQPNTLGYTANITLNGTGAGGALSFSNVKANEGSGKGWQATGSTLPLGSGCEANWNGAEGIYATGSSLALNGAHVWQNAGRGIELAACSGSITGCDISANGGYGMHYGIADSTVAIDGNTFAANADPGILVTGGSLIADHRFYAQTGENTFTVTGADVDIQGLRTLTVDAGVTVRFASNLGLNVAHPNGVLAAHRGSLVVNGSSGSPVTFTSQSGAPGGWEGVTFGPQSDDLVSSTLSYLTVEKAGQINLLGYAANVTLYYTGAGGALSFSNVKANNGAGTGWYAINSVLPLGGGCEASQNSAQGIYASSSTVNATGVTIASNGGDGISVLALSVADLNGCTIAGNPIGIRFTDGATGTLNGTDFNEAQDNGTDLHVAGDAGPVTVGNGNSFAGEAFYINNQSTQDFDLTANGTTFDRSGDADIELRMYHRVDDPTKGLITWAPGAGLPQGTIFRFQ